MTSRNHERTDRPGTSSRQARVVADGRTTPDTALTALRPTRVEVDLDAIRHNVRHLAERAGGAQVCAVVKADGYGHGAVAVARAAREAGATWLAVALVEEGRQLREAGLQGRILVLSEPPVAAIGELLEADLTPTVYREPFIAVLDAHGQGRGRAIDVHLKVDTGMGRVGAPEPDWRARIEQLATSPGVYVEGISTHLARADEPGVDTTATQLAAFDRALQLAGRYGLRPPLVHAANTAGVLLHPGSHRDLVRPGIGVYGLSPSAEVDALDHGLQPALRLVSEVSFAKHVATGTPISYGHRWRAPEEGWVATVPIGYADGVPRRLTNRAQVLLGGKRCPMVGTVTMDQLHVWCGSQEPEVGDEVVLLGAAARDARAAGAEGAEGAAVAAPVRPEEWAAAADTITYEIATSLSARLPRVHLGA